eukprot:4953203-Alexandrium_andersonii.AAC.1
MSDPVQPDATHTSPHWWCACMHVRLASVCIQAREGPCLTLTYTRATHPTHQRHTDGSVSCDLITHAASSYVGAAPGP